MKSGQRFLFLTLTNDLNCFTINTQLISHIPTLYITFCCVFLFTLTIIIFIHSSCIHVFLSLCLLWLCMWCVRLCRHSQLKKTCWSLYILLLLRGNIQIQRHKTKNYQNVPEQNLIPTVNELVFVEWGKKSSRQMSTKFNYIQNIKFIHDLRLRWQLNWNGKKKRNK